MSLTRIHSGNHFDDFWAGVMLPWFQNVVPQAWRHARPSVVLIPSSSHAFAIKQRLLEGGINLAGIQFWTLNDARQQMKRALNLGFRILNRENLHLMLAMSAEEVSSQNKNPHPAVQAIAVRPADFARALDLFSTSGLKLENLGDAALEPLLKQFRNHLKDSGFTLVQECDWQLLVESFKSEPWVENLLIYGFQGTHWAAWPLLQSLFRSAHAADLCLFNPRWDAEGVDAIWLGSWEQKFGVSVPVNPIDSGERPHTALVERMEKQVGTLPETKSGHLDYRFGHTLQDQVDAIVRQVLDYLATEGQTRIGVAFPSIGPLSRMVSGKLKQLCIPHDDVLGVAVPHDQSREMLKTWLVFQQEPLLSSFLEWMRYFESDPEMIPQGYHEMRQNMERAFKNVLVEDLEVLAGYLAAQKDEGDREAASWIRSRGLFPHEDLFRNWLSRMDQVFSDWKMPEYLAEIQERAGRFAPGFNPMISRRIFHQWLAEIFESMGRLRSEWGSHPYARVHLVNYAQAEGQPWTHLILTGLNDGQWPPIVEESGYLKDRRIEEWNRSHRMKGNQGEGHESVVEGRSLMLGTREWRALYFRQWMNLIEGVEQRICLTASETSELEQGKRVSPGILLLHLYQADRGQALSMEMFAAEVRATRAWLSASGIEAREEMGTESHPQIAEVVRRRNDPLQPFSEYEFCLKNPPEKEWTLACKDWEQAWSRPASTWMRIALGLRTEGIDLEEDAWQLVTGEWVHRWLKSALDPHERGGGMVRQETSLQAIRSHAESLKVQVEGAFQGAGRSLPDWWISGWNRSRWVASDLLTQTLESVDPAHVKVEWKIPAGIAFQTSSGRLLRLRGRMDLIRSSRPWDPSMSGDPCVIDFKTSGNLKMRSSQLLKDGKGIQIALYGLALHVLGGEKIQVQVVRPGVGVGSMTIQALLELNDLWDQMARMQDLGRFGMRESLRPEYGFVPSFPLAILPVDEEILMSKWELEHGAGEDDE